MDCLTQLQLQLPLQQVELEKHRSEFGSFSVSESDDESESYIEIALDHHEFNASGSSGTSTEEGNGEGEEEYEFRISISSTIPVPLIQDSDAQHQQDLHFNNHSMEMGIEPILAEPDSPPTDEHHQRSRLKFSSVNRFLSTVSFNMRLLWENRHPDHLSHSHNHTAIQTPRTIHNHTYNNAKTRKEPSMTKTTTNGRGMNMMKLLIKFPTSKIRTLLASLWKPNTTRHKSSGKTKTIIQSYCYHHKRKVNPTDRTNTTHGMADSFRSSKGSCRVLEIDLGAIRGIFSSVGLTGMPSKRTSWSTSSSCGPSPVHQAYADDSIQSAVAYCKTSFQQICQSDFSFRNFLFLLYILIFLKLSPFFLSLEIYS